MESIGPAQRNEKDINENFLTVLTCCACARYLSAPIYQCWGGHSFCSRCFATYLRCPTCEMNFFRCRNVSLEMITRNFLFPCKNRTEGCEAKFRLQELYHHEEICPRQKSHTCARLLRGTGQYKRLLDLYHSVDDNSKLSVDADLSLKASFRRPHDNLRWRECSKMANGKGNILSANTKLISSSTEDGLNQCLPDVLECPVCFECMEPPIRLCRNGHSICSKCRPRLNNCPTCRRTILLTRNIALEQLAEHCLEKCGNFEVGCNVKKTSVQDIIKHMEICPYRLYNCDPGRPVGCTWLGRRWQILNHVRDMHKDTLVLKEHNYCKIKEFLIYDHDLTTQLIVAHGELFLFHHEKDSSKSKFFGAVQYIGPEEDAEKYNNRLYKIHMMAAKLVNSTRLKIKSDLSKSLASLLECPVCLEFMVPPITQCLNGHNICSNCKPRLSLCPTCRVALTITSRNVALENIAETVVENNIKALSKASPQQRVYECLAGKGRGCTWKGRRSEIWAHVRHSHEGQAICWRKETQIYRVSNHEFNVSCSSTQLISIFDQLFWYQFRQDSSKGKWCQAIQYIGAKKEASKYKYTLEFGPVAEDRLKRSIVYSSVTHSDEERIDYIFKSSHCFSTDLNSIKHFAAKDKSVKFKVKIEKM